MGAESGILVTGASGFVGRALCARLEREGIPFRVAVRRRASAPPAAQHVCEIGDIGGDVDWAPALDGMHTVVHLAAHVHQFGPAAAALDRFHDVNVTATQALAAQACAAGVREFVFMSSVKVHGETTRPGRPFTEADVPAPEDAYARSKWLAEEVLSSVVKGNRMGLTVLRPPLVYGEGVGANFRALMGLAASGWPLPLGSVVNLRSFIHVDNLVDAIIHCLRHPATQVRTFLVSDQQDLSTPALLTAMRREFGLPARLVPCPMVVLKCAAALAGRADRLRRLTDSLQVESSLISRVTGWRPPLSVQAALSRTCRHYLVERNGGVE